jgi:hypothetical protein
MKLRNYITREKNSIGNTMGDAFASRKRTREKIRK